MPRYILMMLSQVPNYHCISILFGAEVPHDQIPKLRREEEFECENCCNTLEPNVV